MTIHIKTKFLSAAVCSLLFFTACHHYYKAVTIKDTSSSVNTTTIDSLALTNRYFILQNGSEAFYMKTLVLSADHKTMECILDTVSQNHLLHILRGSSGNRKYIKNNLLEESVLNEVHFHIASDSAVAIGKYSLDLNKIQKIEVIEKDKKRTTNSYVIGSIGVTLGALTVAAIIVAATKSSCPFVSAYYNNEFSVQGEIYGGAIYPQLARPDYIPLKMSPLNDGTLQIKISNELKERQYTDMAELLVITHDSGTKILPDEKGNLYSVSNPQPAISAQLGNKKNALSALQKAGDNEVVYLDDSSHTDAVNEIVLKFKNVNNASKGKLILSLKNSYWVDMLYGELAKGFGNYYTKYIEQQRSRPVAELTKWIQDQQLPLVVSVNTKKGWKNLSAIPTIGPLANRQMAIPVDLVNTDNSIEIKLSSGFMFWEIDYAALDLTPAQSFKMEKLIPQSATDELGKNILQQLQKEDGLYLEQPFIGNVATLVYQPEINSTPLKTQTFILHAKGYYEHIRDFKNKPDIKFLTQFKKPNAFPVYGMQLYNKIKNENLIALTKGN